MDYNDEEREPPARPRCRHACKKAALALASAAAPASAVPRVCKRPRSTRRGHCTGPSGSPVEQMTGKCVGRVGRVGHGMLPAATPWDTPATSVDRQPWKRREWVEAPRLPSPTPFPTHTHAHNTHRPSQRLRFTLPASLPPHRATPPTSIHPTPLSATPHSPAPSGHLPLRLGHNQPQPRQPLPSPNSALTQPSYPSRVSCSAASCLR